MIESLEERCLLSGASFPWMQNVTFNQFTGGPPIVFGYGVTDKSLAGINNVVPAPKFIGLDYTHNINWDDGFRILGHGRTGAYVNGSIVIKVGIEYGYYVNGGTATLLHDGSVSFDVTPPATSSGPFTIQSSLAETAGSVYTQSPTISEFANLVLDFHLNVTASGEVAGKSLATIPIAINFDKTYDLFSINRQEKDANGNPAMNQDGSPLLDGQIKYEAINFINSVANAEQNLVSAIQKVQKGASDKAAAQMKEDQASTPAEKTQAQTDSQNAQDEIDKGTSDESALNKESTKNSQFGAGEALTVTFAQSSTGTLGAQATLSLGLAVGKFTVGKVLGDMTVNLPSIALFGQEDATGNINASTKTFVPGSTDDIHRNLATITVDALALVPGLGDNQFSGPASISADLDLASYNLTASLAVNQTVTSSPNKYPVTLSFTDAKTGLPVTVTSTVAGVTQSPGSTVTYNAGQVLQVQPPSNLTDPIRVSAALDPVYHFSNDIGLDIGVTGLLSVLSGSITAPILGTHSFGPHYTHANTILDPKSLGSIYTNSFQVTSLTPEALGTFVLNIPQADLAVSLVSGPPSQIQYSTTNPTPPADYVVTVTNNGLLDATGVVLTDILPAQIRFSPAASSLGLSAVDQGAGQEVHDTIGDLPTGHSVTVTIGGVINASSGGTITSSFNVAGNELDLDLSNNSLQETTLLVGPTIYNAATETDLRNAIAQVNQAVSPASTPIIFLNPNATITLTQGELDISRSVTISTSNGARALIDAGGASRAMNFTGTSDQVYRLENLVLENGNGGASGYGGAIELGRGGTLSIENSSIIDSTALTGGGVGGVIYAAVGTLTLDYVDLVNNKAFAGGALNLAGDGTTITHSNVSGNAATGNGSAIDQFSTIHHAAVLTIQNSHFTNNQGSGPGASIVDESSSGSMSSTVTYAGSTFSTSSTGDSSAPPIFSNKSVSTSLATFTSLGNNIASDSTGNLTATGDLPNTRAGLFLSGLQQIASGQTGFVAGALSLVWPNIQGTVHFNVSQQDQFQIVGDVLKLRDDQAYNLSTDQFVTVSITATDDTANGVGPNNTNFRLQVVRMNQAPTSITVTSPKGINEATSTTQQPGVLIGSVAVAEPDGDTAYTFHVNDPRFQVAGNSTSGYKLYLAPGQSLSDLQAASIPIQITATDSGGLSVTSPYTVVVNQVPQAPTVIDASGVYVQPGMTGAAVAQLHSYSPNDDPNAPITPGEYTYSVSDPRFEVVDSVLQLQPGQMVPQSAAPIPLQVTATNAAGLSLVQTFALVTALPPTISLEPSATLTEGQQLIASGTISSSSTATATVDYGDGSGPQPLTVAANSTFSLAHAYPSGGSFTATLRVLDSTGQSTTSTLAVTVINVTPAAHIVVAPKKFPVKGPAKFQGAGSDPGPGDTLKYSWTVTIPVPANKKKHLPATTKVVGTGTGRNYSLSTSTKGTYTVTLTVTDNQGATGKASSIIVRGVGVFVTCMEAVSSGRSGNGRRVDARWPRISADCRQFVARPAGP